MVKDKRYKVVHEFIKSGEIKMISQVFEYIPVTTVALMLGTNWERLTKYINEPNLFRMGEMRTMAAYFEVDEKVMIELVHRQIIANMDKKKKYKK
ncbi:MAG TPA: hypothetical protein VMZ03_03965 [Chitinophagaceae bacterium]|nr:hypothetical protein [Chitinophagaceae bacterium]